MQALLASDVIYLATRDPGADAAYSKRSISERFPNARFLPDLGWLDPGHVGDPAREARGHAGKAATPGLHGTGLEGVTASLPGTVLTDTGVNRVPLGDQLAFDVKVQNQGESEETDVGVTVTISGGKRISVDQTIPRIAAGQSETVSIPITEKPDTSAVSTVTVDVAAVPGERNKENNKATYQVAFTE